MKIQISALCFLIAAVALPNACGQSSLGVRHAIDTHIHLYDSSRPDGIPWPPKDDTVLFRPHLPDEYSRIAKASGITGVVVVEASDRLTDNRWVLDLVAGDDFFVALVGNIDPYRLKL